MSSKASEGMNELDLQQDFSEVLQQIQRLRQKVFAHINTALIDLYWQIGKTISYKVQTKVWGKGVVSELARYIAQNNPEVKGFSDKNLWRMKQFYENYRAEEKLMPLVRGLPWTHNTIIFSRCKTTQEREYYLNLCRTERYSSRELDRQINASQFERVMIGDPKLSALLRELHPSIDCLSSLEELITAQTQKLDTLKAYKKGLMQQLFSAVDEVKR
jgi:predicted nuclease of restriction endonuclease-like (RecB) superfamily